MTSKRPKHHPTFDVVLEADGSTQNFLKQQNHPHNRLVNERRNTTFELESFDNRIGRVLEDDSVDDESLRLSRMIDDTYGTGDDIEHAATTANIEEEDHSYFGTSIWRLYWERTLWLVGLLLLQSYASLILEGFEALLKKHLVITLFLPMLIGAGGNASNQSAIIVVRGLATGEIVASNLPRLLARELVLSFVIGLSMMFVAYGRVYLFHSTEGNGAALAVGAATMAVMLLAIGLGTLIPLAMDMCKIDPAHSGPVVAVMVDLCGVAIICTVCSAILS